LIQEEKMMKKMRFVLTLVFIALAAFLTTSCILDEKVSAEDCMQSFADDLNSGNFDLGGYTHSDATTHKASLVSIFWETLFAGDGSFTFTMNGNSATATEAGVNYVFTLEEDDKNKYAIRTITRSGVTIFD
jgi:hypothetical protein